MSKRNSLIAAGVACFVAFIVALAPARILADLLPREVATLTDAEGTVWSGSAQSLSVAGLQFSDVRWDLHALALLIGRLSASVEAKWGDGFVQGDAAIGLTGALRLRDVRAVGPLAPITQRMNLGGAGGELAVEVAALDVVDDWPTRIVGELRVGRVALNLIGVPGALTGNYRLSFDMDDVAEGDEIPGALTDGGGPLEIVGELRLTPPRNYSIQARIKARPGAPPELANGLALVGPRQPDGSHQFRMSGSL